MLSLSKFFLFALLISPGFASCQDQQVKADSDYTQTECRSCGCNKNKTTHGKKVKTRCGICAPAPEELNHEEIQEERSTLKCGCTPPPPEPPRNDDLNLINTSEVHLECGCSKKKRNNLLNELLKEFDLKRPNPKNKPTNKPITQDCGCPVSTPAAPNCGCPVSTPAVSDCGCPVSTPAVSDCGCPVLTFAETLGDVQVKCGICAPAPEEQPENPEDSRALLKELFETVDQYIATHETTVQDALLEVLQDLAQAEATADQNSIDNQSIN